MLVKGFEANGMERPIMTVSSGVWAWRLLLVTLRSAAHEQWGFAGAIALPSRVMVTSSLRSTLLS